MNFDPNADPGILEQAFGPETGRYSRIAVRSIFPLLIGHSLSLGWWIPAFYNWSGADQSRSPAIVGYTLLGFTAACMLVVLFLPLLPKLQRVDSIRNPQLLPIGFPMVGVFLVAIVPALFIWPEQTLVGVTVVACIYPFMCAVKLALVSKSVRWRIVALYSCMYLPFVWIFGSDVFQGAIKQGSLMFVPIVAGGPALLFAVFIRPHQNGVGVAIAMVIAAVEIVFGLWVIQLGARRAIAYQILLLVVSVFTSFSLHALLRA